MKIHKNSLLVRVLLPIFALIGIITFGLLAIVNGISGAISEDYQRFTMDRHADDVKNILDGALTEMVAADVMDNPAVVEAKKRSMIEALKLYWSNRGLDGIIIGQEGNVLFSSVDAEAVERYRPLLTGSGHAHVETTFSHTHGYSFRFPAWGWTVTTVTRPMAQPIYRREVSFLLPLIALGSLLMAAGVYLILKRNFQRPVAGMMRDLKASRAIAATGVDELDRIGGAINDAVERISRKTDQYQLLHGLAISIHESMSVDDVLDLILDRASGLIRADLSAIALYDESGGFKKLLTRGTPPELAGRVLAGQGLLGQMRLSEKPVRIDDVLHHPAFSGSFPEGHPKVGNLLGFPIPGPGGTPRGALYFGNKAGGFTEDDETILAAIAADAAIALGRAEAVASLLRFKEVIDSAFDMIFIADADGRLVYANPAFETTTGYSREDLTGNTPDILRNEFHGDEHHQGVWDTIRSGRVWRGEFINKNKDGAIFQTSAIIFPITTDQGVNFVSIQRDITQEKRLYEQLLRAQKMEAIGTLAGGIAHDFNNLLTGILGYSEILLMRSKEGCADEGVDHAARVIHEAAERGADLAKKILMITRKEKMEVRPVDVNAIISSSVEFLSRSIPKDIEMTVNLKDGLPMVGADPTQLQQVIMNLCVNARDAMPNGGRLTIETGLVGAEDGASSGLPAKGPGFVKIGVSDTGTGMDTETQRKVFDPFFTTKEVGRGTGLGLYIVHSVVSNHGGYVNLYSEPGKGTRFNIYLPVTTGAPVPEHEEAEGYHGTGTVLVIDDEEFVRGLCKDMLGPRGFTVLTAADGQEGVNLFRERKDEIRLVILDMIMPKMGGREVFQALKAIDPDVKVLLFSGYSHNGFAGIDSLVQSGVKGFMQKPFARKTLLSLMKRILEPPAKG